MDLFLNALSFLNFSFVTDQTKFFKIPMVLINWVILGIGGFYFWSTLADGSVTQISIAAGAILVFLILSVGRAMLLLHLRAKKRQYLYKLWKHSFTLQQYKEYDKDSSKFLKIRWDGLKGLSVEAHGEVGRSGFTSIRELKEVLGNLDKMLPRKNMKWVIDFNAAKIGTLKTHPLPVDSEAYLEFMSEIKIYELTRNIITFSSELPDINFVQGRIEDGFYTFDEALISDLQAQDFSSSTRDRLASAYTDVFPLLSSGVKWVVETNANGQVRILRATVDPMEEWKKTQEENEVKTPVVPQVASRPLTLALPPLSSERNLSKTVEKDVTPALNSTPVKPTLSKLPALPPMPERPKRN